MDLKRLKMYSAQWLISYYHSAIMNSTNPDEVNDLVNTMLTELASVQRFDPAPQPQSNRDYIGRVVDDGQLGLKMT